MKSLNYNDGIASRGRKPELLIFTPNKVFMGTASIPGTASIVATDYHKNGKWSSTSYTVTLAEGVGAVAIRQDFSTGKYFPDTCLSWAAVGKALGLNGVSPNAVEAAVREHWPRHAERFDDRRAALLELEEATPTTSVEWEERHNTNRIGLDVLLVDGMLFQGKSIPGKVVVLSADGNGQGGRYSATRYRLQVAEGVELEYLTEGGFPGDDSLEERGWNRDNGSWAPPTHEGTIGSGNTIDLSALDGLFS